MHYCAIIQLHLKTKDHIVWVQVEEIFGQSRFSCLLFDVYEDDFYQYVYLSELFVKGLLLVGLCSVKWFWVSSRDTILVYWDFIVSSSGLSKGFFW